MPAYNVVAVLMAMHCIPALESVSHGHVTGDCDLLSRGDAQPLYRSLCVAISMPRGSLSAVGIKRALLPGRAFLRPPLDLDLDHDQIILKNA